MGRNYLADIPGNFFTFTMSHASTASNGAAIRAAGMGFMAPANLKILSVARHVEANECTKGTATSSASYRTYSLLNGGSSGTGTTNLASLAQTASQAAYSHRAFTLAATPTVSSGELIWFSVGASVGGAVDDTTTAQAALVQVSYELL